MRLGNYDALWLLFIALLVIMPAYIWCFWRKSQVLKVLASIETLKRINIHVSLSRQILKAAMLIMAFILIVIALTRPAWNPKPRQIKRIGRDIVILLDTSRSMLAEDIKPNRLERAKIAIGDLMDTLEGDRIAIVTFAGNSSVKCPLTQDYAFVRSTLADISTESSSRGGTQVGDAIRMVTKEVFDEKVRQYKDLILITDGDDHDSFPVKAAEEAGADGIRIIAVGLGNESLGARIPVINPDGTRGFLKYNGEEVWTKLNGDALREVAIATPGGKYIPVETGTFDLDEIYQGLIASAQKRELKSATMMQYDERFQLFLLLGIILIFSEVVISERKKV